MEEDQSCEVCVVGGGVTGALCALKLTETGRSVTLITAHAAGFGDTEVMSPCVQADGGVSLTERARLFPPETGVRLMRMGLAALDEWENRCHALDDTAAQWGLSHFTTGFTRRDSLLCAVDPADTELLRHEFAACRQSGLDGSFLSPAQTQNVFPFVLQGGIVMKDWGATLDPYRLSHLCLARAAQLGAQIYENTGAADIETPADSEGSVVVTTSAHRKIYAEKLILATGSQGLTSLLPRCRHRRLRLTVTQPCENGTAEWPGACVVRTFGKKRQTLCLTPDRRLFAETDTSDRLADRLPERLGRLRGADGSASPEQAFIRWFPDVSLLRTAYGFDRRYAVSPDELPLIGIHRDYHNCIFALTSGRGALLQAQWAAQTAADICENLFREEMALFTPMRFFS